MSFRTHSMKLPANFTFNTIIFCLEPCDGMFAVSLIQSTVSVTEGEANAHLIAEDAGRAIILCSVSPSSPDCLVCSECWLHRSGGGGGTKGPAVVDKRNVELECPHCDRTFKQVRSSSAVITPLTVPFLAIRHGRLVLHLQVQRFREHIQKKHAAVVDAESMPSAESASATAVGAHSQQQVTHMARHSCTQLWPAGVWQWSDLCRARQWMLAQRQASTPRSPQRCSCMSGACRRSDPCPATASQLLRRESRSQKPRCNGK